MNPDIGKINAPAPTLLFGSIEGGAIGVLLNIVLNIMLAVAGIYALFNFMLAGYAFLSAGDDPKKVEGAWAKIYLSVIGLLVSAGSLVLAAIFDNILFGGTGVLLYPTIPTL